MASSREGSAIAAVRSEHTSEADGQPLFQKLKPGPGLPAEQVVADQRRRLHGATIALVERDSCGGLRVRSLARTAGVSTSTFYRHFVNAEDCLSSTFDAVTATLVSHGADAQRRETDWRDALHGTIAGLMKNLASEPKAARFALVDIFDAGPSMTKRISRAISGLEGLIGSSFTEAPQQIAPPRHLVAGMTAGMLRVARTTTLTGRAAELPASTELLTKWMLLLPQTDLRSLVAGPGIWGSRRERDPFPMMKRQLSPAATREDRHRLLRAVLRLAIVDGLGTLTASKLCDQAGVSRRKFEATFEGLDECFLDALETVVGGAAGASAAWSERGSDWVEKTTRFVLSLCAQAARNPALARLTFLGPLVTGRPGLLKREEMVGRSAASLLAITPARYRPSPISAEASVAAAWHIAQCDVIAGRTRDLPSISLLLSYIVLAPIVGQAPAVAAIRAATGLPARQS